MGPPVPLRQNESLAISLTSNSVSPIGLVQIERGDGGAEKDETEKGERRERGDESSNASALYA